VKLKRRKNLLEKSHKPNVVYGIEMVISNGIKMVVGLGNPGDKYVDTRHNMGFRVIDLLAETLKIKTNKRKFGARMGAGEFTDKKLILLKPWQWMNRSGEPVAKAVAFYKLALACLLVVTDDMDLEPGRIRIRAKGSAGGHKGLTDIIQELGTDEFARLRIGIGRPPRLPTQGGAVGHSMEEDAVDFVLGRPAEERPLLNEAVEKAHDAVLCWIERGIEATTNRFNAAGQKDAQINTGLDS
jgi:PTH1 family peptidyl-tRNA hydrolase